MSVEYLDIAGLTLGRIVAIELADGRRMTPECECAGLIVMPDMLVACDVCGAPWHLEANNGR